MASHKREPQKLQHRDQASLLAEGYSVELAKHHINVDAHLSRWWHWCAARLTLLPHELCHIGRVVTDSRPPFVPKFVLIKELVVECAKKLWGFNGLIHLRLGDVSEILTEFCKFGSLDSSAGGVEHTDTLALPMSMTRR